MLGRVTKGLLHLLVGGACAALVSWLVFGFTQTLVATQGPVRLTMAGLVLLTLLLVTWLLLAPAVRPAEVALARALLEVDLPEPVDTTSWGSRGRGLLWAVLVITLGGVSLFALLWSVPQGAALVVAAWGAADDLLPGMLEGWHPVLLALAGVALSAAGVLVQPLLAQLLRGVAPTALGPTDGDRLAQAQQQRLELLRSHELARELHDSIGHALTAIGVQAEAGARVARADPDFARQALARIAVSTRDAVAELDEVLGALRRGHDPTVGATRTPSLAAVADLLGPGEAVRVDASGDLDEQAERTAYRVVQEALSNARRHGLGGPVGHVRVRDEWVEVLVENRVGAGAPAPTGGRGLLGMRERLALVGGTVESGPHPVEGSPGWRLTARIPTHPEEMP